MQLMAVLREFRGSAHLLAVIASGLAPKKAHYIHRPEAWALFGWSDEDVPEITDEDRQHAADAEALTDRLVTPAYSVLDEPARADLLDGAKAISATLGG